MPSGGSNDKYDAIIIGGGVSGLAAAASLTEKGYKTLVVEARDRLGGRIHSAPIGTQGGRVDLGASFVHGQYGNPIYDLADSIGLDLNYNERESGWKVVGEDGDWKKEAGDAIISDAMEAFFDGARQASQQGDPSPRDSMATFILSDKSPLWRNAHNAEDRERAIQALRSFGSWTAAPIEKVSLKWWGFARDTMGPDREVTKGNYHKLIDYLAERGGDVCLNSMVTGVHHDEEDGSVVVTTSSPNSSGNTTQHAASFAICTLPLGVLQNNPPKFNPPLPIRKTRAIQVLGFGVLNKIVLRYDQVWWRDADTTPSYFIMPTGSNSLFAVPPGRADESTVKRAMIFVQSFADIDGTPQLVFFMGADYGDRIETATEEVVTQWAHGLAAKVLRPANMREQDVPKPQQNGLTRTAWRSDPYSLGSYTYIPPASGGKNDPSPLDMSEFAVPIWDNRLGFAGEHTHCDQYASVHGAYNSGLREGKRVAAELEMFKTGTTWEW